MVRDGIETAIETFQLVIPKLGRTCNLRDTTFTGRCKSGIDYRYTTFDISKKILFLHSSIENYFNDPQKTLIILI